MSEKNEKRRRMLDVGLLGGIIAVKAALDYNDKNIIEKSEMKKEMISQLRERR